ncbi:MAG: DegT/DnrJ/EryC1/StrS family aminotransferase [Actinomycetota bacterium]
MKTDIDLPLVRLDVIHSPLRSKLDAAWADVVDASSYVLGPPVEAFEQAWAEYCGVEHAIGVGSGTEAIELVLRGLGIGPGDEVIVPASTFIATAAAVVGAGASPVFSDVRPGDLLLTAEAAAAAITPRTAAILPVHLYGTPVDIDDLRILAEQHVLALVEDAAQAHGATYGGRRVGGLATAAAFSHYPTKNLGALGDGGSITTDDPALASAIRKLRNHGRDTQGDERYDLVGRTGRLHALQAAMLSIKLPHLDNWVADRQAVVTHYDRLLPCSVTRIRSAEDRLGAPHLCVVRTPDRDRLRKALAEAGIGSGIHYPDPVPRTPAFGARLGFPVAEEAADTIASLPLWPGMTAADVERVCDVVRQTFPES